MASSNLNTEIVKNKHVLFVGAGASAPLGLKPTQPFLELLIQKLPKLILEGFRTEMSEQNRTSLNQVFVQAAQHFEVDLPDSEVVLDYLNYLSKACDKLDSLPAIFRHLAKTGGNTGFHRQWGDMFSRVQAYIQKIIVEHYSTVDGELASRIYKPLLEPLCRRGQALPIYTTNYDWAFEHLAEANEADLYMEDGFMKTPTGERWAREAFDKFSCNSQKTNLVLFKLHGSTSWYRDEAPPHFIRKFSRPAPELAGSRAALIYPTQVKIQATQEEPFRTAYEYLRETMMHANLGIIIGFSFRDPTINDTIRYALANNNKLKLAVVEPKMNEDTGVALSELVDKLGIGQQEWKGRMRVIKGRFGDEPLVYEEVARTVQTLDHWDALQPWVETS
jgi:hypothetical protein